MMAANLSRFILKYHGRDADAINRISLIPYWALLKSAQGLAVKERKGEIEMGSKTQTADEP